MLKLIHVDPRISRRTLAEMLDVNSSAIARHLGELKRLGYIRRVGGNRGYWTVIGIGSDTES